MPGRYREIAVRGTPRELGRQLGEAAGDEIRGFAAFALERIEEKVPLPAARALEVARECIPYVETYAPDMLAELRGLAESTAIPLDRLMLLQVRNQLRPDEGGCTAFSLARSSYAGNSSIVAQNWDNDPALDSFTVVLTRRPQGKPAMLQVTQAGLIAYIGLNEEGIGLCMNTLPAPGRRLGVPHYFTVRSIYESCSLDEAVASVRRATRAIPANILLATPQGPADLEITIDAVHLLRDSGTGIVTHTNHCLHPELAVINEDFTELIESGPRKRRIDTLLAEARRPLTIEMLKTFLCDHQGYPCSICRHVNDHAVTGYWTSVFSVIIEAEAGRLHLSRGNPCTNSYEVYEMN